MVSPCATEQETSSRKCVIDAGAAIKLQRLERFGGELFTTGGVIREIKDEQARTLLGTLPMELKVKEPSQQDMLFTKQFAKATGDLGFLSRNDLDLIALTVSLHRESGGTVKQRPAKLEIGEGSCRFEWAPGQDPAVKLEAKDAFSPPSRVAPADAAPEASEEAPKQIDGVEASEEPAEEPSEAPKEVSEATKEASEAPEEAKQAGEDKQKEDADKDQEAQADVASDDEDGSSGGEWVTQENMHRFGLGVQPAAEMKVTCATADYSVQNVLLQMGITPLTFDGFSVRSVKLWGLVCRGCFHFSRDTTKVFCPKCGNDTVVRVPIIVDQDGQAKVLNSGRPMRKKGSVYSVPKPQGGRGWKPIYAEDEVLMGGRDRQLRHAEKVQDRERQARDPFNEDNATRAWYQRPGAPGRGGSDMPRMQAGLGRRSNPNANNFKHKNSKRR